MLPPHRTVCDNLQNYMVHLVFLRIDEQSDETRRTLRVRGRLTWRCDFRDHFVVRQIGRQFLRIEVSGGENERQWCGVVLGGVHGPE
jgi:hypothetical protein